MKRRKEEEMKKKVIAMLLVVAMVISMFCIPASADENESFSFKDFEWFEKLSTVRSSIKSNKNIDSKSIHISRDSLKISHSITVNTTLLSFHENGIAGYSDVVTSMEFINPIKNGTIELESKDAELIYGEYCFPPLNTYDKPVDKYWSIKNTLVSLYGEPTEEESSYECSRWIAEDGSKIVLYINYIKMSRMRYNLYLQYFAPNLDENNKIREQSELLDKIFKQQQKDNKAKREQEKRNGL